MADHHKQTDHADVFRDEAESAGEEREAASRTEGDELNADSKPTVRKDADDNARNEDSDWGFDQDDSGMATETKIGLALIVVLLATFGFVVYRKLDEKRQLSAMAESSAKTSAGETRPKDASAVNPPSTAAAEPTPADQAWQPFQDAQSEPESMPTGSRSSSGLQQTAARPIQEDPFADPRSSTGAARPVAGPAEESDNPFAMTARSQSNSQPSNDQVEDLFQAAEAGPSAATPRAASSTVVTDLEDPFLDPVSNSGPVTAAAQQGRPMPDRSVTPAAAIATTGAAGGAEEPPGSPAESADVPFDPFASEPSGTSVASPNSSSGSTEGGQATVIDEPADLFEPVETAATQAPPAQPRPLEELPAERRATASQPAPVDIGFSAIDDVPTGGSPAPRPAPRAETNPFDVGQIPSNRSLPGGSVFSPTGTAESVGVYEVQHGDNYWKISRKVYGTPIYFTALARANRERIPDPTRMRPGMKVLAPPAEVLRAQNPDLFAPQAPTQQTATTSQKPEASTGFFIGPQGQPFYRVGSRDTLSTISQKHLGRASRWIEIYELNRKALKNPNDLQIGDELLLPRDASRVSLAPQRGTNR